MFSKNSSDDSNVLDRATRPGTLLALLLIGFMIAYFLIARADATGYLSGGGDEGDMVVVVDDLPPEEEPLEDEILVEMDGDDITADEAEPLSLAEADETDEPVEADVRETYDPSPGGEDIDKEPMGPGDEALTEEEMAPEDEVTPEEEVAPEEDMMPDEDMAEEDDFDESEGRHRACIYVPSIDRFHVIDDYHLTVSTSPRRIYLLTLLNRCREMNWTHKIAYKSRSSWSCSSSLDSIIADGHRCLIDDIERVSSVEEAEEIVARRNGDD